MSSTEELDEVIEEFLVESNENLDQLDRDFVELEDALDDRNRLSNIFRTIHTIKGTCGFLGFPILEHVTHVGEGLLVRLRDGELRLNGDMTDALLAMVDAIRTLLSNIAASKTEGSNQYDALVDRLERLRTGVDPKPIVAVPASCELQSQTILDSNSSAAEQHLADLVSEIDDMIVDLTNSTQATATAAKTKKSAKARKPANHVNATSQSNARKTGKQSTKEALPQSIERSMKPSIHETAEGTADLPPLPQTAPADVDSVTAEYSPLVSRQNRRQNTTKPVEKASESDGGDKSPIVSETTVRIDVQLLDRLMNLVGELVLARNQIMQISHTTQHVGLIAASQRLSHITTELQEGVMKTRMQPIRNAWNKVPRVVRDLSQSCGKQVNVEMEGTDTELDKTILEAIKDPLIHIVRNSVDHGIELPDLRLANGKPAEGTLLLRAFHEGGQVNIEISDDGAGIHLDRVRSKAVEKGLITPDRAAEMSDCDVMNLILLPGFSTATKVTNVSGRGVGMDVVKTNVERIGGTLDITSIQGQGTTLRIKIPLTLAIVPALVVTCQSERYSIPQVNLIELVRLERERHRSDFGMLHSVPVFRLRGQLLPIIFLDEELGLRARRTELERQQTEIVSIVVLQAEDRQFGLVVDRITDTQEIVVKPLGRHLKKIGLYAGSTIMGDGDVSLILDVIGLARQSHVLAEHGRHRIKDKGAGRRERSLERHSYLIVDSEDRSRTAIELSSVARLEYFRIDQIERSGQQLVVQYRGEIMPLIALDGHRGSISSDRSSVPVVVFRKNHRHVGIIVERIVDIVEHDGGADITRESNTPQIIAGRVTQVVDLMSLVDV